MLETRTARIGLNDEGLVGMTMLGRHLLESGVRIHEHTPVRRLGRDATAETSGGTIRARSVAASISAD